MKKLQIAKDFAIPAEPVETFAILAKRGSGKTYTALKMAEQMLKANIQMVVIDPIGVCWGLRSSADGKSPGLPIIILGGDHADVPLEVSAGATIANFVIDEKQSVVLDLSLFRKGEQVRFMTDFAETLYHKNRAPLHMILDEADAFAPQRPQKGQERMLGAVEDLVRRGRTRGIGITLVTQRSAVLNKDVLTQTEVLIALRTTGTQDRNALDAWVEAHGTKEQRQEFMAVLASLPIGTAWFWSPGWLNEFRQVKIAKRETFDSSATPKMGERTIAPKQLAEVDLEGLKKRIQSTIEKAKAEDPRELRKRIVELERTIKKQNDDFIHQLHQKQPKEKITVKTVNVPILKDSHIAQLGKAVDKLADIASSITKAMAIPLVNTKQLDGAIAQIPKVPYFDSRPGPVEFRFTNKLEPKKNQTTIKGVVSKDGITTRADFSPTEQAVLDALASFPNGAKRQRIAVFSGRSIKSSSFNAAFPALVRMGLCSQVGSKYVVTDSGMQFADPKVSGVTLDDWMRKLKPSEAKVLQVIAESSSPMTREQVAEATGQSMLSSSFHGAFPALRDLGLIEGSTEFVLSNNFS